MRILLGTGLSALLAAPMLWPVQETRRPGTTTPGQNDACATGCSAVPATIGSLDGPEIERLLSEFVGGPASEENQALETLLFHGAQVKDLWETLDRSALDAERGAFLRRELARTHARLDVRFVDDRGVERLRLGDQRVPLGIKEHLFPIDTQGFQPPEISGTVRRVGLKHLWARL